jgi:hypothetical protein
VSPPGAQQGDGEIAPGVGTHERNRVMPLAEPDPHTVRELPLKRLAPRPVEADSADRNLDRHTTCLVKRGKASHFPSLSRPTNTKPCRSVTSSRRIRQPHSRRRPSEPLSREERSTAEAAAGLRSSWRVRGECQMALAADVIWPRLEPKTRRLAAGRRLRGASRPALAGRSKRSGTRGKQRLAGGPGRTWRSWLHAGDPRHSGRSGQMAFAASVIWQYPGAPAALVPRPSGRRLERSSTHGQAGGRPPEARSSPR